MGTFLCLWKNLEPKVSRVYKAVHLEVFMVSRLRLIIVEFLSFEWKGMESPRAGRMRLLIWCKRCRRWVPISSGPYLYIGGS